MPKRNLRAPITRCVHLLLLLLLLLMLLLLLLLLFLLLMLLMLLMLMLRLLLMLHIHGLQMCRTSDVVNVRKPPRQPATPPDKVGTRGTNQPLGTGPGDSHLVRERERRNLRHTAILPHLRVYRLKTIVHGVSVLAHVAVHWRRRQP